MEYITSAQPEQALRYAVYSVQNRMDDGLVFTRWQKRESFTTGGYRWIAYFSLVEMQRRACVEINCA